MDEFSPKLLPLDRNTGMKKACLGLCVVATQPGPDPDATTDPSANSFITFNEPVLPGPCFDEYGAFVQFGGAADCQVQKILLIQIFSVPSAVINHFGLKN